MSEKILQTNNSKLQEQLNQWLNLIELCTTDNMDLKRTNVMNFSMSFVPLDVIQSPEDLEYFSSNLYNDEEYFVGIKRDISQCASGRCVESIKPSNQIKKATFVLLPLPELSK